MTFLEAQQALASKLNIDFSDIGNNALFSLQELKDALNFGTKKAWDYKPWTFSQSAKSTVIPNPYLGYIDYPADFEDESIILLSVNGVPFTGREEGKRNFVDYQKWFGDFPTDTLKLWAEFQRFIFINPNAVSVGQSVDLYGKLRAPTLSGDTDLLPFSPTTDNSENSGNEAVVVLAYAHLLSSEKKNEYEQALVEEKRAYGILDIVWKPMGERRAQSVSQNRPFFNTQDNYRTGRTRGTNIGNFP